MDYLWPGMTPLQDKLVAATAGILATVLLYRKITSIAKLMMALWIGMPITVGWVIVSGLLNLNPSMAFFPTQCLFLQYRLFDGFRIGHALCDVLLPGLLWCLLPWGRGDRSPSDYSPGINRFCSCCAGHQLSPQPEYHRSDSLERGGQIPVYCLVVHGEAIWQLGWRGDQRADYLDRVRFDLRPHPYLLAHSLRCGARRKFLSHLRKTAREEGLPTHLVAADWGIIGCGQHL